MGESGQRRSTLVSRLPIFRRSSSKRQESLPSSPSSGGVGNGVHTSSPSSTNSSTSSTGKRRSLFRTPSLSFHSKRNAEHRNAEPVQLSPDDGQQASESALGQDGGSSGGIGGHTKTRHSFGFGGHRHKKIPRSQTEDFDKGASSTNNNRNVFINCISSGANEGDDSGFLDDVSSKRSSKHKKHLLPKSFSAHHRFSRTQAPEQQSKPPEGTCGLGTPGSWPGELAVESSLQSPMLSEDRTTAITPSEFVHVTEDSVSEVDALPPPSPAAPLDPPGESILPASAPTSQVLLVPPEPASEPPSLPDANASATVSAQCESITAATTATTVATVAATAVPATTAAVADAEPDDIQTRAEPQTDLLEISESEPEPGARELELELSEEGSANLEPRERRPKNPLLAQEARKTSRLDTRQGHLRKPNTVSLCSSMSPYHEVMRLERRLRSASEGAGECGGGGGRRQHLGLREPHSYALESIGLHKQRTNSSSSKLGSLVRHLSSSLSLSLSISPTLSLSPSLSLSLSLPLSLFLPLFLSTFLSLSLFLPLFVSLYLSHSLSFSLSFSLSTSFSLSLSVSHSLYISQCFSLSLSLSISLSLSLSLSHSLYISQCFSLSLSLFLSLSPSLSVSLSHTLYLSLSLLLSLALYPSLPFYLSLFLSLSVPLSFSLFPSLSLSLSLSLPCSGD
ncbi:hypothetical protein ACEWY4_011524 [Coilia grayii]|uniref:Serine-rich coiled-coil domain-containing protein 1 n=1 Tax=Coilia grayii TaxID=363190 RepID=A0ABD1JY24_9TELE